MNRVTLDDIRRIVEAEPVPTGDAFLDARYEEQIKIVGHTQPYYRSFYRLARELRPALSVELGSWQATAAAHLAAGYPGGQVITIDIHKDDPPAQVRTREAAMHYPNLTYLNAWTWDAAVEVRALGISIDLLYIDAWHQPEYLARDWQAYQPLLAPYCLIVMDDVFDAEPSIKGVIEFFASLTGEKFTTGHLHPSIPMGFCLIGGAPVTPPVETVQPSVTRHKCPEIHAPADRGRAEMVQPSTTRRKRKTA